MTEALELQPSVGDGDLARAAADGDGQAFAEIYDRYADRLYDFCVGLIGDRDAAADCVQDAFCVAATDLGGLREPDKLRPWLYSIARHHAMRRLRHRYREEVSNELPDMVSHEASPETLAGQSELARLVADAAGGLSDRDRELLDLSYRHGLDGPELAEALGVTLTSANTMMFRLRQTVERCLGALLVARGAHANPDACPELTAILKGWDGQFSVLMRKRMARHIDSCDTCEQDQRKHVNPVALLGSGAVFIPAPAWLRRQTLDNVQLTCASSGLTEASGPSAGSRQAGKRRMTLVIGIPLVCLGLAISWFARSEDPVVKVGDTGADSRPLPVVPAAVKGPPTPGHPQPAAPVGAAQPSAPTQQVQTTAGAGAPSQTPAVNNPGAAPILVLPNAGIWAPAPAQIDSATVADSDPQATDLSPQVDAPTAGTEPVDTPTGTDTSGPASNPPLNLGPLPNPNLNTKIASSFPNPNTATITNPKDTSLNLQPNTNPPPKSGTTSGSSTTTGSGSSTKPGSGTTTGGSGSGNSTNSKSTTSTSK
ncbi:MAG: sigma-70 family RNA polymerase sigma factor [Candidatus Nanopelagicales bacterium]